MWSGTVYQGKKPYQYGTPEWPDQPNPFPQPGRSPQMTAGMPTRNPQLAGGGANRFQTQAPPGQSDMGGNPFNPLMFQAPGMNQFQPRPTMGGQRPMQPSSPMDAWRKQYFPGTSGNRRPQTIQYTPPGGVFDDEGNRVESFGQNNPNLWNLNPLRQFAVQPQQANYYD